MSVKVRNTACEPVFKTWGLWLAAIPAIFCCAVAIMCAISTFIGFIVFTQSMGYSSLKGLLIAAVIIISGICLVALIARFLAFRLFRNRTLRLGCTSTALCLAIGAFAYGVMISVYLTEPSRELFFGMTPAASPAFLAGWLGIWFVLMFQKVLGIAREEDGKSDSITEVSPSAKIISMTRKRR